SNPYSSPNAPPVYGDGYPPPPAYGGTQPLPQPPATSPYGGYPAGPPPSTGGSGYPPTGAYPPPAIPPTKSSRGLALAIGGGLLALIVIVGGVFAFTRKGNDSGTATTTPTRATVAAGVTIAAPASLSTTTAVAIATQTGSGGIFATIAAAATGTANAGASTTVSAVVATDTPQPQQTPTPLRAPTTAATATTAPTRRPVVSPTVGQGGLPPTPTPSARVNTPAAALGQTWTDPNGRLTFQYPNGWTVTKQANSQSNLVEVDGPDNVSFSVYVFKQSGTLDEELQGTMDALAKSTQYTYTFGSSSNTRIGGEPGKQTTYTGKRKDQQSGQADAVLWIVNHGNSEYDLQAVLVGTHRAEVNAIIASIVFTG
ncbi:MAG: hypothetical protein LC793_18730, partial [Thermomicrobia bacterium]|nr:hypothetical protein [Thermomicrobia bacterium]